MSIKPSAKAPCPSGLRLDAYCAGESDASEKEELRLHIAACERCRLEVERRQQGFAAFGGTEQAYLARFRNRVEEHDRARVPSTDAAGPRQKRRPWSFAWKAAASVLATAGLAVILMPSLRSPSMDPQKPERSASAQSGGPGIRAKGGPSFEIFRSRDGIVEQVADDATLQTGDRLRFRVSLPRAQELMLVGQEQSGELYPVAGSSDQRSMSMQAGSQQLLEQTIELDDSQGREALHLVSCSTPFTFDQVLLYGKELESPEACSISSVFFDKVSRTSP